MGFRDMQEQNTFHAGREYERKILAERITELEVENKALRRPLEAANIKVDGLLAVGNELIQQTKQIKRLEQQLRDGHYCTSFDMCGGAHDNYIKRIKELEGVFGLDNPWSLLTCAKQLVIAASHLLNDHNCDMQCERTEIAKRQMQKYITKIEQTLKG